jgi:hypothetical protein
VTRDEFMKDPVLSWLKADKNVEPEWVVAAWRANTQMNEAVLGHLVRSISRVGNLSQAKATCEGMAKHLSADEIGKLKDQIAQDLVEDEEEWRRDFDALFAKKS